MYTVLWMTKIQTSVLVHLKKNTQTKNKRKVALEAEELLPVTLPKDICHGKHCVYVGTVYSGTTPEIQNRSLHVSLRTMFSII